MRKVGAKRLPAAVIVLLLAIISMNTDKLVDFSCFSGGYAITAATTTSFCHTYSAAADAAEYTEASCSPFTQPAAKYLIGSPPSSTPPWLTFQPYLQPLLDQLDKPPRTALLV